MRYKDEKAERLWPSSDYKWNLNTSYIRLRLEKTRSAISLYRIKAKCGDSSLYFDQLPLLVPAHAWSTPVIYLSTFFSPLTSVWLSCAQSCVCEVASWNNCTCSTSDFMRHWLFLLSSGVACSALLRQNVLVFMCYSWKIWFYGKLQVSSWKISVS